MNHMKFLGLLSPTIRRLQEELSQYASLAEALNSKAERLASDNELLTRERDQLLMEKEKLNKQIEKCQYDFHVYRSRRLHIIGYARSGTTVLMDILNSSSDVFLFSEFNLHNLRRFPDLFSSYGGEEFVEQFAERKKTELPLLYKGAVPPVADDDFTTPDDYIDIVGRRFRYYGDKIATSHRQVNGISDLILLEEFINQEENSGSIFIFTLRRPSENLLSVSKMFPDADIDEWGRSIVETTVALIEAFLKGKQSYLVFHNDIGPQLIAELEKALDLSLPISRELVGRHHQSTKYQSIADAKPWIYDLDDAYDELYRLFQFEGPLKLSKTDGLIKKIAPLIDYYRKVSRNDIPEDKNDR